ncbi:MAG: hypothetical protein ABWW61_02155 [Flavobacteriales bacterium]|nr:hypothetical protein [Cryomorphaceae bacterium]
MRKLLLLLSALILASCGARKNSPPSWISGKPIDASGTFVYGVGSSYINPNTTFQQAARSNALADLAQEVQSEIYDETKLLQKEDAEGFNSAFESNTTSTSALRLQDYELVESYADEVRFYTLYRLDLQAFLKKKALQDAEAMQWINGKFLEAKDMQLSAPVRLSALVDALDKAYDYQLFGDIKFKTKLNASATEGLRNLEQSMAVALLIPEELAYLGLPATFNAKWQYVERNQIPLTIQSSSGQFILKEQQIQCLHTGHDPVVQLSINWDWDNIQSSHLATKNWLKNKSQWNLGAVINFQKPSLQLDCPDELREDLTQSLSQFFAVQTEEGAKLGLESRIDLFTETSNRGTHKVIIDGTFILTAIEEYMDVLWKSSNTIEGTAISSSKERAMQSAKNAFLEDFNYFVLPQLQRSLDY